MVIDGHDMLSLIIGFVFSLSKRNLTIMCYTLSYKEKKISKKVFYKTIIPLVFLLIIAGCSVTVEEPAQTSADLESHAGITGSADGPVHTGDATVKLIAGKSIDVGSVSVFFENGGLLVRITTQSGWGMTETHLAVAPVLEEIPQTKKGNPIPGKFPFKKEHLSPVSEESYFIPLADAGCAEGSVMYLAAHAEVVLYTEGGVYQKEGAWAEGAGFPGKNWGMYFLYLPMNTERLIREEWDWFNNGTIDDVILHFYDDQGYLKKTEKDRSNDGSVDEIRTFTHDDSGFLIREAIDLDADGVVEISYTLAYDGLGYLTEKRMDLGDDGVIEAVYTYLYDPTGKLTGTDRDENNDGMVDLAASFFYDADGNETREEWDRNVDGTIDWVYYFYYDCEGRLSYWECDSLNDGKVEQVYTINYDTDGRPVREEWDWNNDGSIDLVIFNTWVQI
jgi:hypothetical protein